MVFSFTSSESLFLINRLRGISVFLPISQSSFFIWKYILICWQIYHTSIVDKFLRIFLSPNSTMILLYKYDQLRGVDHAYCTPVLLDFFKQLRSYNILKADPQRRKGKQNKSIKIKSNTFNQISFC